MWLCGSSTCALSVGTYTFGGTTVIYQLPKLRLLSPVLLTRRAGQMFPFSLLTDRLTRLDGNCECLQGFFVLVVCKGGRTFFLL